MNTHSEVFTQAVLVGLVVVLFIGWIWSDRWMHKKTREYDDSPHHDPYIETVRAMREANPNVPMCAVSIQDQETGEFYYYPMGSEVRMKRHTNGRLYADPATTKELP